MQKIVPHLWFDKEAKEAAEFYVSAFGKGSKVKSSATLHDTPSGDADMLTIELWGQEFMMISAGPYFKINPSISFHVKCATEEEVDAVWAKLSPGGKVLMELGSYPFSKRYGWCEDKYGVSWQVIHAPGAQAPFFTPVLLFVGAVVGKAEEAMNFYTSVFKGGTGEVLARYVAGEDPEKEGTVKYEHFSLLGQEFGAMDSAREHKFAFNEAVSLLVKCDTQEEIDYYWEKLSAVPESEQCGWLKDKYGVSWQIAPAAMDKMMDANDPEKMKRVTQAFLKMKKFNLAELERAAAGN